MPFRLTAFVLQSLIQAKEFIYIDQTLIERSENWVLSNQEEDGSFPNVGSVINKEIQVSSGRLPSSFYCTFIVYIEK